LKQKELEPIFKTIPQDKNWFSNFFIDLRKKSIQEFNQVLTGNQIFGIQRAEFISWIDKKELEQEENKTKSANLKAYPCINQQPKTSQLTNHQGV
jgi:hypothetical protein